MAEELKIIISADDKASPVLNKTKGVLGGLGDIAKNAFSFATGGLITSGIQSVADKLLNLGKTAIMGNAEFEQYNTQFTVMLRNASGATEAIPRLSEEAIGKLGDIAEKQTEGIQDVAKAAAEDARRLAEKLGDYAESHAERQKSINKQMQDDTQSLLDKSAEIWRTTNDRIAEMSRTNAERQLEFKQRLADADDDFKTSQQDKQERLSDTLESIQERYGDRVTALKEKLSETENKKEAAKIEAQIKLLGEQQAREEAKANEKAAKEAARDKAEHDKKTKRLQEQIDKENAEFERQTKKLQAEASLRVAQEKQQHERKLADLREALDKENAEYEKQTARARAEGERQVADNQDKLTKIGADYSDALAKLKKEYTDIELGLAKPPQMPPPKPLISMAEAAQLAKSRMVDLEQFALKTPFELPSVVQADTILQAFGFHSQDTAKKFGFSGEEIRTIAGDTASGARTSFEEMTLLLGRFASGATGEAIMRMGELGIATRTELEGMGLSFAKSGQLTSPLPEAMNVVLTLMKQKYGGLMDTQSTTFNGMVSNLDDWIGKTSRKVSKPIFNVLETNLAKLLTYLDTPEAQGFIDKITKWLEIEVPRAVTVAETFLNDLKTNGIQGLLEKAKAWVDSPETQTMLKNVGNQIGQGLIFGIKTAVTSAPMWASIADAMGSAALPAMGTAVDSFRTGLFKGLGLSEQAAHTVGVVGGGPVAWIGELLKGTKGYASGGIVPGPLGMPQLAVVHGGETVTPAGGVGYNAGGGLTFVYAPQMSLASESEITNVLTPALDRWYRNAQRRRVVG